MSSGPVQYNLVQSQILCSHPRWFIVKTSLCVIAVALPHSFRLGPGNPCLCPPTEHKIKKTNVPRFLLLALPQECVGGVFGEGDGERSWAELTMIFFGREECFGEDAMRVGEGALGEGEMPGSVMARVCMHEMRQSKCCLSWYPGCPGKDVLANPSASPRGQSRGWMEHRGEKRRREERCGVL